MSFEALEKLEQKIQEMYNNTKTLQAEVNNLKDANTKLQQEKSQLVQSQQQLMQEHERWKAKLANLLSKFEAN